MAESGICKLCGSEAALQDSHLISKSILKRYFVTAPTGAARSASQPNRRTQKFQNKPLLCFDCEQRFAVAEKIWSQDFEQHLRRQLPWSFECKEEHRYFAASLVWRTIVWENRQDHASPFTDDDRARIRAADERLRAYLLGGTYSDPHVPWLHLVTAPHGFTGAPPKLNVYLRGSLDATINGYGEGLYCILVLGGYLIVGVLSIDDALITWTLGTELRPGRTVHVDPRRFPEDIDFRKLLVHRAAALTSINLSERQQDLVNKRVEAAIHPSLRTNEHVMAMFADYVNEKTEDPNVG